MKGNQSKQNIVGADNKRITELEDKLTIKTKQHDQLKEK